jgi:hypothetical protein
LTGYSGIIPADPFQLAAKGRMAKLIHESLDGRQIQVLAAHYQVVSLAHQRHESQARQARSRAHRDAAVGSSGNLSHVQVR